MANYMISKADYQGYGVYEMDGHLDGLGQLPNLGQLTQAECINGLGHVPASSKAMVVQALETMVFTPDVGEHMGGVSGQAAFNLGSTGGPWVSDLVAKGYVVMAERNPNVQQGVVRVVATDQPASVVMMVGCPNPNYVIVAAAPTALAAAEAYKASGAPTSPLPGGGQLPPIPGGGSLPGGMDPAIACGPGMWGIPPACISLQDPYGPPGGQTPPGGTIPGGQTPPGGTIPGGQMPPGGQPPPAPVKAGLPKWVLPVAIVGSVAVVGLVAFASAASKAKSSPAPKPMTANTWWR